MHVVNQGVDSYTNSWKKLNQQFQQNKRKATGV